MSEEVEIQQTPAATPAETAPEGQQGAENHQEEHRFPKHVPIGEHVKTRQERNRYRDEANTLRAKLEVYERGGVQPQGQQQAQEPAKPELPKRPSMDTFKTRDEYESAVDEWAVQVAEAKAEAKANERIEAKFRERDEMSQRGQAEQALAKTVERFTAKTAAAAATVPDINDRVAYLNDPEIVAAVAPQIWQDIMDSDAAAELVVELTNDVNALQRLMGDPIRAARELGRLEAKIAHGKVPSGETGSAPAAPQKPSVAPTRTVRGPTPVQKSLAEIARTGSIEEYEAARRSGIK